MPSLALLGWFKYYGFFSVNVDNLAHGVGLGHIAPLLQVGLPIAISFYTFMAISYVVDIYRRQLRPAAPIDLALYLSFFPHLLAGPIVRGEELLPQIRRRRDPRSIDYSRALWMIMAGLFKKVVISSYISTAIVQPVFTAPAQHSGLEAIFAAWGYGIQIYCDFSGYTDIAIGLALLLGIRFPVNFDAPYTARNLQDFWRRWHITLVAVVARLPLHPARGKPRIRVACLSKHHDHHGLGRSLARGGLDVRHLGGLARRGPVGGPSPPQVPGVPRTPGGGRRPGSDLVAALLDLSVRLVGLGLL